MKKNYVPQPMDTSDIQLPEELNVLIEQMAKNVHEVWARSRIEQGWSYGEERNDTASTERDTILSFIKSSPRGIIKG